MSKAKSFYIFDFDDNLIHTGSQTFLYHKETKEEIVVSSSDFIKNRHLIGHQGNYKDYLIDPSPMKTFKMFSDEPNLNHFPFIEDLQKAVGLNGWQGPSWERFIKAIIRDRTMSIVTARGHHPDQIEKGIHWLAQAGHIPKKPDIHSIYALTHPHTQNLLRWTGENIISSMKKQALDHFIETIYSEYGHEPPHRFGFSDDDPSNIASTRQKFIDLKQRNPHHSFFLYEAKPNQIIEEEIVLK
jgi:hypothetical protein